MTIEPAHTLRFPQLDREIPAQAGASLFQSARHYGVRIVGACGGRGTCGTCLVHVAEGNVEPARRRLFEQEMGPGLPGPTV